MGKHQVYQPQPLIDRYQRRIKYLRLSVTDRCDFRCVYCMAEDMQFVPRPQILSLEELYEVGAAFVRLGVEKIRITGGEPMVRANVVSLMDRLSDLEGMQQLCITTNGSQLAQYAKPLKNAGVTHLNISLDSLREARFKSITRTGRLSAVLAGIDAALSQGFERIKLNTVVMKDHNDDEVVDLIQFAVERGIDISFIEEMPLGQVGRSRQASFLSSEAVRAVIREHLPIIPESMPDAAGRLTASTGGPSRYWRVEGTATRLGFISPHSENFCSTCNRVRVTAEGRLLLCLGHEHSMDLREVLRSGEHVRDEHALERAIMDSMALKPERHEFVMTGAQADEAQVVRFMNMTGG